MKFMSLNSLNGIIKAIVIVFLYVIPCHTYVIAASFSHTEKFDVLKLSLITDMSRSQESDGYRPMFEIGKTWVYRLVDKSWGKPDTREDMWRVLKVDGVTEIDGKEYFVVNAYTDGAATPDCDAPYGYFREDVDSREVFYVRDERYIPDPIGIHEIPGIMAGEESLLYRFCKPVVLGCVTYDSEPDDYINVNDGKHRGVGADGPCGVFEGVGAIMMNNVLP